ncbi:hypothetical protein E5288_WYG012720 [Bos mutus]|uniref:Uncharacterized protein n=1 Tax=Bos mutus TaxID=72004 RepID=A0A6B0QVF5_9CETA|nr:hypothetical protein [Bos mutus]
MTTAGKAGKRKGLPGLNRSLLVTRRNRLRMFLKVPLSTCCLQNRMLQTGPKDRHEDPGDLKGQQTLCMNSLLSRLEFSHSVIGSKSSKSPKVTAVKVDLVNFIHKCN